MQRTVTFSLVLVAFVGIVAIGVWQVRRHLPTPTELATVLQRELTQQLKVPVRIGRVEVGWWGATVHQVLILPDRRRVTCSPFLSCGCVGHGGCCFRHPVGVKPSSSN
jgi:hypothetical protein